MAQYSAISFIPDDIRLLKNGIGRDRQVAMNEVPLIMTSDKSYPKIFWEEIRN